MRKIRTARPLWRDLFGPPPVLPPLPPPLSLAPANMGRAELLVEHETLDPTKVVGPNGPARDAPGRRAMLQNPESTVLVPHDHHVALAPLQAGPDCGVLPLGRTMPDQPNLGV
jgi:hypothetical protein